MKDCPAPSLTNIKVIGMRTFSIKLLSKTNFESINK